MTGWRQCEACKRELPQEFYRVGDSQCRSAQRKPNDATQRLSLPLALLRNRGNLGRAAFCRPSAPSDRSGGYELLVPCELLPAFRLVVGDVGFALRLLERCLFLGR